MSGAGYRLFVLDEAGRVVDSHPFETDDDDSACAWAIHVAKDRRFELWHGKRRIQCSHEGPSVLDHFYDASPALYSTAPVWFAACAIRS